MRLEVRAKKLAEWFTTVHATLKEMFCWGTDLPLASALDPHCIIAANFSALDTISPERREDAFTPGVLILAAIAEARGAGFTSDEWRVAIEDVVNLESQVGKVGTLAEFAGLRIASVEDALFRCTVARLRCMVQDAPRASIDDTACLVMRYLVASAAAHYRLSQLATSQRPAPVDGLLYLGGKVAGDAE